MVEYFRTLFSLSQLIKPFLFQIYALFKAIPRILNIHNHHICAVMDYLERIRPENKIERIHFDIFNKSMKF